MAKSSFVFVHKGKEEQTNSNKQKSVGASTASHPNQSLPVFQEQILKRIHGISPLGQSSFTPNVVVTKEMSSSPAIPVNIAGFDWDRVWFTLQSNGFLFFLGDDNKADHAALQPVLFQLLGVTNQEMRHQFLIDLRSKIDHFFIHTQGIEVELVDEKGDPLPQLFYSGKKAIIKCLEALYGKRWQEIIPEDSIHSIRTYKNGNPVKKSRIAISRKQYNELKEKITAFRQTYLKKQENYYFLANKAFQGDQWSEQFIKEYHQLVGEVMDQPNVVNFFKQLKPEQQHLFGKAVHLYEALDVIIERYKRKGLKVSIENLFMIDDDKDNCAELAGLRDQFKEIKRMIMLHHRNRRDEHPRAPYIPTEYRWDKAIPNLLSNEPNDVRQCTNATFPKREKSALKDKYFYSDFSSEVKAGHWETLKIMLKAFEKSGLLESKMEEICSHAIDVATLANEVGKKRLEEQPELKNPPEVKSATPARSVRNRKNAANKENDDKLVALQKTFMLMLDSIIKLLKEETSAATLKICHKIFSHPEVQACFSYMDKYCGSSIIEYLLNNVFVKRINEYFPSTDDLNTDLTAPLSTLLFLLENVKDVSRIHDPAMCDAISRVISLKKDPLETTKLVKHLVENCNLNVNYIYSGQFFNYIHPIRHAIGIDPENKNRFALCKYLISKGITLDNKLGSGLLVHLIETRDFQAIQFFCENAKVDLKCDAETYEAHINPLTFAFDRIDFENPHPEDIKIFEYLNSKTKLGEHYIPYLISEEKDVSLISVDDHKHIEIKILEQAKHSKTPLIIQEKDKFFIYGNTKKDAEDWMFTEITQGLDELKQLPFTKEISILKRDNPKLTPSLINALKHGHAIEKSKIKAAKYLCEKFGVTSFYSSGHNGNAFEVAVKKGYFDFASYLLTKGLSVNGHSTEAELKREKTAMERMFGEKYFAPLLIRLVQSQDVTAIKYLCEHGADVDVKDTNGNSAIDILTMTLAQSKKFLNKYKKSPYDYLFDDGYDSENMKIKQKETIDKEYLDILEYLKPFSKKPIPEKVADALPSTELKSEPSANEENLDDLMAETDSSIDSMATKKAPVKELADQKADLPVIESKQDKKSEIKSNFDPLFSFVMYLASKGEKVDKTQMDEILHYARWFLKTGGTMTELTQAAEEFFVGNKANLIEVIHALVATRKSPAPFKPFSEVKSGFEQKSVDVQFPLPEDEMKDLSQRFLVIDSMREKITALDFHSFKKGLEDIAAQCEGEFKRTKQPTLKGEPLAELLALLREAYWRTMGIYPNDTQMFNVMALINDPKGNRLAQIKTGEGKSTIMAILSSYYALLGLKPDVVTTHDSLAERDVEKLAPFYSALGLKAAYVKEGRKLDTKANILYGTFHAYESLWLGKETGRGLSRGDRPYDICLVDEADNLFIDEKQTSLRYLFGGENNDRMISLYKEVMACFNNQPVTQSNPVDLIIQLAKEAKITLGNVRLKDHCLMGNANADEKSSAEDEDRLVSEASYLYDHLWRCDNKSLLENVKDPIRLEFYKKVCAALDAQLSVVYDAARKSQENQASDKELTIKLDHESAKKIFNDWVDATYCYKKGIDYHIIYKDDPERPGKKKPVEVEFIDRKNTGQVQENMRYSTMHTFLEIMHKVPPKMMESIVCRTNHLSYMKKYQYGCKCVTGTAGDVHDREELKQTCGIHTYDSPPDRPNLKKAEDPVIVKDSKYQATLISEVSRRRDQKKPVVIFVESVKESEDMTELLRQQFGQDQVQFYNAVQKEMPESIIKQASAPGMVTVVTNIGGRGMDITTSDESPLHLIFTNLFAHKRVEAQAIGRTGRQGKEGSYNYVLSANQVCKKMGIIANQKNMDRICKDPNTIITKWYQDKELESIKKFKDQLANMYLDYLIEELQHIFMTLSEQTREDNLYRWAVYISAMDHIYTKGLPQNLSTEERKKAATEIILREYLNFWKSCHLDPNQLWDILEKQENTSLREKFNAQGVKRPGALSDLRVNSIYQPVAANESITKSCPNLNEVANAIRMIQATAS